MGGEQGVEIAQLCDGMFEQCIALSDPTRSRHSGPIRRLEVPHVRKIRQAVCHRHLARPATERLRPFGVMLSQRQVRPQAEAGDDEDRHA